MSDPGSILHPCPKSRYSTHGMPASRPKADMETSGDFFHVN
jgi:hypothetical protein